MMKIKNKIKLFRILIVIILVSSITLVKADSGWDSSYDSGSYGGYSGSYGGYDYDYSHDYDYSSYGSGSSGSGGSIEYNLAKLIFYFVIYVIITISFVISQIDKKQSNDTIEKIRERYKSLDDVGDKLFNKCFTDITKEELKDIASKIYSTSFRLIKKTRINYIDMNIIKVDEDKSMTCYFIYEYEQTNCERKSINKIERARVSYKYNEGFWVIDNIKIL